MLAHIPIAVPLQLCVHQLLRAHKLLPALQLQLHVRPVDFLFRMERLHAHHVLLGIIVVLVLLRVSHVLLARTP